MKSPIAVDESGLEEQANRLAGERYSVIVV